MNEVIIIINGVRYDAVENQISPLCDHCDLLEQCDRLNIVDSSKLCHALIGGNHFKKSDKSFEK